MALVKMNSSFEVNISETHAQQTADGVEYYASMMLAADKHGTIGVGQGTSEAIGGMAIQLARVAVATVSESQETRLEYAGVLASDIFEGMVSVLNGKETAKERREFNDKRIKAEINRGYDSELKRERGEAQLRCPYCDADISTDQEGGEDYVDGNYMTCPKCGCEFWATADVEYTWSSYRIREDGTPFE